MARQQIADRIRDAEADRIARATRRSRALDERSIPRRFARTAIATVLWPVKH